MRNKANLTNIDKSTPSVYPNGRIQDNTGAGNGTPVNEEVYGDFHEMKDKLMRRYNIVHNDLPDNETNGYQFIEALQALPSKNDFSLTLTNSSTTVLRVPLKLGRLQNNEVFILRSQVDRISQGTIRGSDNVIKSVQFLGNFKSGEFVRMINTSFNVILVRMVDFFNAESALKDLNFLTRGSRNDAIAGTRLDVALTPLAFKEAFRAFVNTSFGNEFLATNSRPGIFSAADKAKLDSLQQVDIPSPFVNRGFVGPLDVRATNGLVTFGGDAIAASGISGDGSVISITLKNSMRNTRYLVKLFIESRGTIVGDNDLLTPVFRIQASNRFQIFIEEGFPTVQSVVIHFETVQL